MSIAASGRSRPAPSPLLPVEEAIARVLADVVTLPAERVPLIAAHDRTLAEPLVARRTQPPFPASAMDGYAVRAGDLARAPATLQVIGQAAAGHGFAGSVASGEAVRIFTGAPVPPGADAVLVQEETERLDATTVLCRETVKAGRHVRAAGLDFRSGDELLPAGTRLGARQLALAAAANYAELAVARRPRVAIIATGDELLPPGHRPGPDQIIASNGIGLAVLAAAAGAEPRDLGIVRDDEAELAAAVDSAATDGADILVTIGGASVGDHDLVRTVLAGRGMVLDFWRLAMRPGKPLLFGRLGPLRVLGLPGNPVSSLVGGLLFLRPLIGKLLGQPYLDPTEPAIAGAGLSENDQRQDYLRAKLVKRDDALPLALPLPRQDSSLLADLAAADCLLIRPPRAPAAPAGSFCRIIRLI